MTLRLLASLLLLLPAIAPAQPRPADFVDRRQPGAPPREERAAPLTWKGTVDAELASAPVLAAHSGHIVGIVAGKGTLQLLAQPLAETGTTGTLARFPIAGVPATATPRQFAASLNDEAAFLLVEDNGAPAIYRATTTAAELPTEFAPVEWPEAAREPLGIATDGVHLFLASAETTPEGLSAIRAFGRRIDGGVWLASPPLAQGKRDAAIAAMPGRVLIVGGDTHARPDGPVLESRFNVAAEITERAMTNWQLLAQPMPRRLGRTDAHVSPRAVVAVGENREWHNGTTQPNTVLSFAGISADGAILPWQESVFDLPWREGMQLIVDEPTRLAILLGGRGADGAVSTEIAAIALPGAALERFPTPQEERQARLEALRARHPEVSLAEAQSRALAERKYMLTYIPGDNPAEDGVTLSLLEGRTLHPYLEAAVNYIAWSDAASRARDLGVQKRPALVLHTARGTVLGRHEGTEPTRRELFDLTKPMRAPADRRHPAED